MDKKKEGLVTSALEALAEAARINIAAEKEMASSAVTTLVDTVTGREKPRRAKRRISLKKVSPASKRSQAATTKGKAGRRTATKKPAVTGGKAQRKTATKARGSSTKSRKGSKSRSR